MADSERSAKRAKTGPVQDLSTLSNPNDVRPTHGIFEWALDFEAKRVSGTATWKLKYIDAAARAVKFDTKSMEITGVTDASGGKLEWTLHPEQAPFGQALEIALPNKEDSVTIAYRTGPEATAIQWLEPSMTAGKKLPFLFTQCQAIHARSLVPCQDTPQVKTTYEAKVTVPTGLVATMSALGNGDAAAVAGDAATFSFNQPVAMAAYLIAIAVGDLKFKKLSDRCGVWAETSVVEEAADEFAEMEAMLSAAEQVCGPYVWGRYDVLCMPPSFPYGGMENPCLTFVTPTLLAGDRSLADVVIHEIAHSWTGNLVTNESWQHFWLNEGWTMFVQRKVMGILQGQPAAEFDAMSGTKRLVDSVDECGCDHTFSCLLPDLKNIDPDDAFSSIPYEKGFSFLWYLQTKAGGAAAFDPFVLAYMKEFAHRTLTSYDFKDFYLNFFKGNAGVADIDWDTWLLKPGMPPCDNVFDDSLEKACVALVDKWLDSGNGDGCSADDTQSFKPAQILRFLDLIQLAQKDEDKRVTTALLTKLGEVFNFKATGNCEIKFRWCMICIKAEMADILPLVVSFVTSAGRMKYVRPLYKSLFKSTIGRKTALATFSQHKGMYHPICSKMLARDLDSKNLFVSFS